MRRATVGICVQFSGATLIASMSALAPSPASAAELEEITITARKRDETLFEVPQAVTAIGFEELDRSGAINLEDVASQTPGLQFHAQGGAQPGRYNTAVRFRGMDTNQQAASQQLGTVFLDGIYVSQGVASLDFSNVDRVEIIRGPSSALLGRSTFAGAINYVTKAPSLEEVSGRLSAEYSRFETYDLSAAFEAPIVRDKVAVRLSARSYGTGGQFRSVTDGGRLGQERTTTLQAVLYAEPTDRLSLKFRALWTEDDDGPPEGFFLGGANSNRGTGPNLHNCFARRPELATPGVSNFFCGEVPVVDPAVFAATNTLFTPALRDILADNTLVDGLSGRTFTTVANAPQIEGVGLFRETYRLAFSAEYGFDDGLLAGHEVAALFGASNMKVNWLRDIDLQAVSNAYSTDPQFHEDFTAEVRLTSPQDKRLRYLVGASYFDVRYNQAGSGGAFIFNPVAQGIVRFAGIPIAAPLVSLPVNFPTENGETRGIYGSLSFDVLDNVTLDAELRYQIDEVGQDDSATTGREFSDTFKNWLPAVTVSYKPVDETLLWVKYSKGNLPGFFNSLAAGLSPNEIQQVVAQVGPFGVFNDEEELDNYELGWRQKFLEGRGVFSAVGYFMDWTNQKTRRSALIIDDDTGLPTPLDVSVSVGSTYLWGAELEGSYSFSDRLSTGFSFNWAVAEYQEFTCGLAPYNPNRGLNNCEGNRPPRFPEFSGAFSATWEDSLNADWDYFVRGDVTYFGEAFVDESNFAYTPDYFRVALRAGVRKDNMRLEAFVRNLLDDDTYTAATRFSDLGGPDILNLVSNQGIAVTPARQRSFGLRFSYDF